MKFLKTTLALIVLTLGMTFANSAQAQCQGWCKDVEAECRHGMGGVFSITACYADGMYGWQCQTGGYGLLTGTCNPICQP